MPAKTRFRGALISAVGTLLFLPARAPAEEAKIEDPVDRASYSLGHQIGRDLRQQDSEVDTEAMRRGLVDGLSGAEPAMDPQEMERLLAALKRKTVVAERERKRQAVERSLEEEAEFLADNGVREGVVTLESGLQYEVLREGGGRFPGPGDKVAVHYRSTLIDGTQIHDSHGQGDEPETLHVSGVIRGLTEALQLMREGSRWQLFLPPNLAYGRRGPLAHRTVLIDVELVSVETAE